MTDTTTLSSAGEIALGTMYLGTRQGRDDSFAILDRFVDLGGRWIDTANVYSFWQDPSGLGGASERMLGAWLSANPGVRDRVALSTKVGADPMEAGRWPETMEGLAGRRVVESLERSLDRLATDRVELYWAHVEDRSVELEEQVAAFGALVADGRVGRVGASNHATWRVERARRRAADAGLEPFSAIQLRHTFLQPIPFADIPDAGGHVVATPEALDFARTESLEVWAYSTLLSGAYERTDRPLSLPYRHVDTDRRLAALDTVARRHGATRNHVVLAWLMQSDPPVTPIVGVSSPTQLTEVMESRSLHLDESDTGVLNSMS